MSRKTSRAPIQINFVLKGDKRLVENLIFEVRAIAERRGLEMPKVRIAHSPAVGPKVANSRAEKVKSPGSNARRRPSV
jgi:hypothetical protein